jgi:hypothetical protein
MAGSSRNIVHPGIHCLHTTISWGSARLGPEDAPFGTKQRHPELFRAGISKSSSAGKSRSHLRVRTCFSQRPFRKKSSNDMAFPHPQSRNNHDRKENTSSCGCVVWKFFKRTINITEYRNGHDDVNPAKNRTYGGIFHASFPLHLSAIAPRFHDSCAALGGVLGVSIPNCLAYSACSRCHPNFIASAPTMRPSGVPLRT